MKETKDVNILVVGDIMLDHYILGEVKRISAEAPVPIVNITNEYSTLGGCGNVIRNLRSIGANVTCVSKIGSDEHGAIIVEQLKNLNINSRLVVEPELPTIVKTRVIAGDRRVQLLRLDKEVTNIKIKSTNDMILNDIRSVNKKKINLIVVSDYAKGLVTHEIMKLLRSYKIPIIVDPKPQHGIMYQNVFMITPNEREYMNMMLSSSYTLKGIQYILKTMGKRGMELIQSFSNKLLKDKFIPAEPVEIYNVSGAGDTVVAIISTCIAMGMDVLSSAKVANKCAGYVVTKSGTSVVPKDNFDKYIEEVKNESIE